MDINPTDVGIGAFGIFVVNKLVDLIKMKKNNGNSKEIALILERVANTLIDIKSATFENSKKLDHIDTNIQVAMSKQITVKDIQSIR